MNEMFEFSPEPSGFESRNCVDIWIDGPGDTTVRPCPPELLPLCMAERERIARWQKDNGASGYPGEKSTEPA